MAKYWYFTTVFVCHECGHEKRYRVRRELPRPERKEDRYEWVRDTTHAYSCLGFLYGIAT